MSLIVNLPDSMYITNIIGSLIDNIRTLEGESTSLKPRHHIVVAGPKCFLMFEQYVRTKYMFLGNDSGMFSQGRIKYRISPNGCITFVCMEKMSDNEFYCSFDGERYPNGIRFLLT